MRTVLLIFKFVTPCAKFRFTSGRQASPSWVRRARWVIRELGRTTRDETGRAADRFRTPPTGF